MSRKRFVQYGLSLLAVVIAGRCAPAQASTITVVSGGSVTSSGSSITGSETVLNETGGFGPLTTLTYVLNTFLDTGSGLYVGPDGTLDFSLSYVATGVVDVGASESINGSLVFTGGSGDFSDATGSGTFDFNYLLPADGGTTDSSGSLVSATAVVQSNSQVPEPAAGWVLCTVVAPLCLLGLRPARRPSVVFVAV